MEKLDELFTEKPTRGTRCLSQALKKRYGLVTGRDYVSQLIRILGIAAINRATGGLITGGRSKLRGFAELAQVIKGIPFVNGEELYQPYRVAA